MKWLVILKAGTTRQQHVLKQATHTALQIQVYWHRRAEALARDIAFMKVERNTHKTTQTIQTIQTIQNKTEEQDREIKRGAKRRYFTVHGGMETAVMRNSGHASALATSLMSKAYVAESTVYAWESRAANALVAWNRAWHMVAETQDEKPATIPILFMLSCKQTAFRIIQNKRGNQNRHRNKNVTGSFDVLAFSSDATNSNALKKRKVSALSYTAARPSQPLQIAEHSDDIAAWLECRKGHCDLQFVGMSSDGKSTHSTMIKQLSNDCAPLWINPTRADIHGNIFYTCTDAGPAVKRAKTHAGALS